MKKVIQIEGMSCHHCEMHVEKSLLSLKDVKKAKASHIDKTCEIVLKNEIENEVLIEKVKEAGYTVTSIEEL
ncbi:MAG: heavy metal-associated domain-containing protein [Candidatus Izemoplasmatales bacterium]|jgi:copper chaperone CopZ|nr:heavy metal-associated domain-containing protein [Candidatus Izemoplasmatales bacterium]